MKRMVKEDIIRMYLDGSGLTEIASIVGYSIQSVKNVLTMENLWKKKQGTIIFDDVVARLYKKGITIEEISFELSLPITVVSGILKKQQLLKNHYHFAEKIFNSVSELANYKKKIASEIIFKYEKGMSIEEIASIYKLKFSIVRSILSRARAFRRKK